MKKKAIILIVFMCFALINVFGQEQVSARPISRVLVNNDIINLVSNSENNLDQLHYFISEPLTIIIDDQNTEPEFVISNGTLMYSDRYLTQMVIQINTNNAGRLHLYSDNSAGSEVFEIIFNVQNRFVTLRFRKNEHSGGFVLFSAIINGRRYNLNADSQLPLLMISSNLSMR